MLPPKSAANLRTRGFSLIEMFAVLTFAAILLAFTAPALLNLQATGLTTAGREFQSFLNLCRSEAIAGQTSIRLGVVVKSTKPDQAYRRYAAWKWNKTAKDYRQHSAWISLPESVVFEKDEPRYLGDAAYAQEEGAVIRGDHVLQALGNTFEQELIGETGVEEVQFFTFSPSGRASLPRGEERNLLLVLRLEGDASRDVRNWVQFSVDTLTGRTRVYRP